MFRGSGRKAESLSTTAISPQIHSQTASLKSSPGSEICICFGAWREPSSPNQTNDLCITDTISDSIMTHLTIAEDPGDEFTVRAHSTLLDADDDEVVFYNDITKVHVVPERATFTMQVVTPDFVLEMDFADSEKVHEALDLFEAKKVLEVDFDSPNSVRIIPSSSEPIERE
jgi:hypothetical protein